MDDRDADRRAVARGLRRAFAVEPELPDRFRDLLDRLGGQEAREGDRDRDAEALGPPAGGAAGSRRDH